MKDFYKRKTSKINNHNLITQPNPKEDLPVDYDMLEDEDNKLRDRALRLRVRRWRRLKHQTV